MLRCLLRLPVRGFARSSQSCSNRPPTWPSPPPLRPRALGYSSTLVQPDGEAFTSIDTTEFTELKAPVGASGPEILTPQRVVEMLDRHIVGQRDAKRAVAVALRNRWRRHRIAEEIRAEIVPKNILMIGPTGCGKTEIARRLAKLADAPFVKVEATKFTEVGFHGRDVDQIIRDLVDNAIQLQRQKVRSQITKEVEEAVANQIVCKLTGIKGSTEGENLSPEERATYIQYRQMYDSGGLDLKAITTDLPERTRVPIDLPGPAGDVMFKIEKFFMKPPQKVEMLVKDAKPRMIEIEMEKHLSADQVIKDAIELAESDGIVFIDEIDKIVSSSETRHGADASAEGVQRDLLPIIEGSIVNTKYGNVNTDHILFIASGAFHSCKPSDMLAELQGRLPIRVELKGLTREDLYRILTEPETNLIRQQVLLMKTEQVDLVFTDDAIEELANVAAEVNKSLNNIGARRLHTVIERVVEDVSFHAPEMAGMKYVIDKEKVRKSVGDLLTKMDLSKFVL